MTSARAPSRRHKGRQRRRLNADGVHDADMRQPALLTERVDSPRRNAEARGDFAGPQQTVSKREPKRCQNLMTRGIIADRLSSIGESLRIPATPWDKPVRPFKLRVVGSIPTRLTP